VGGIFGFGSSAKQPTAAGSLQFSSAQRGGCITLVYGTTRVAGIQPRGGHQCDRQRYARGRLALLPRTITFGAGAGSTGLVIQGALISTWPFRLGTITG